MKLSVLRRVLLGLSVFVVLAVSAFMVVTHIPGTAHADTNGLTGVWSSVTLFTCGSRNGQTSQGTFTYASNGTMTTLTSDGTAGQGTWMMTDKNTFHYTFTEQIYKNGQHIGYVVVVQDGTLAKDGNTNQSTGQGVLYVYTPGGPRAVDTDCSSTTQQLQKLKIKDIPKIKGSPVAE